MNIIILLLLSTVFAADLRADGFRNPSQSVSGIGQANAVVAQADDPSAIFYNPAGLTQLSGVQFMQGIYFLNIDTRFSGANGAKTNNDLGGLFGMPPPGVLYLTAKPKDLGADWLGDLSVGVGLQSLFAFGTRFPDDSPLNTAVKQAKFPLVDIKPTLAYPITDWLSLGFGVDVFTFFKSPFGEVEQRFNSPGLPGIPAGSHIRLQGSGTTVGYNASALVTVLRADNDKPKLNLGLVWRSDADLPIDGKLYVNGARVAKAKLTQHFPPIYSAGIAYWPLRDNEREWKIETDLDYVRWRTIKDLDLRLSNGATLPNRQFWKDAISTAVGTEYKRLNWPALPHWDLALRAGMAWSQTPVPDINYNPAFADSNLHSFSVGAGLKCKPGGHFLGLRSCGERGDPQAQQKFIGVDVSYSFIYFEARKVTRNPNPAVNGRYNTKQNAFTLGIHLGW